MSSKAGGKEAFPDESVVSVADAGAENAEAADVASKYEDRIPSDSENNMPPRKAEAFEPDRTGREEVAVLRSSQSSGSSRSATSSSKSSATGRSQRTSTVSSQSASHSSAQPMKSVAEVPEAMEATAKVPEPMERKPSSSEKASAPEHGEQFAAEVVEQPESKIPKEPHQKGPTATADAFGKADVGPDEVAELGPDEVKKVRIDKGTAEIVEDVAAPVSSQEASQSEAEGPGVDVSKAKAPCKSVNDELQRVEAVTGELEAELTAVPAGPKEPEVVIAETPAPETKQSLACLLNLFFILVGCQNPDRSREPECKHMRSTRLR